VTYGPHTVVDELWPADHYGPLGGGSVAMRALYARMDRLAGTDATVLIAGETGTGKELVARAIHDASPRAAGPFIVVDCGSIPESLFESELFGHARGAFTGAVSTRVGALELADGGSVLLDEIGELPLAVQPKLLRALEARTIRRVGESEQRAINVRFVAASHRDLAMMSAAGAFREDLYYRLAVVPLHVPSLRERAADIPALIATMIGSERAAPWASRLAELQKRPWPGNVRELRNLVERAEALGPEQALLAEPAAPPAKIEPTVSALRPLKAERAEWNDAFERAYVRALLARHGGNITRAAEAAEVDRSYLHRLIRRHGIGE